ncbi:uncharacterized protein RMCB_6873 [Mycolicibacterium brisbanense]|uniref:Uncharacterized protein n=1 Tax=Mycolicibacterium brisbanense TaxID=146020 RepID=A0A117I866_9MYCO|nr:uncharacterized protein RMCB_6873 [Mycolicibacterium brisbanense]
MGIGSAVTALRTRPSATYTQSQQEAGRRGHWLCGDGAVLSLVRDIHADSISSDREALHQAER